MRRHRCWERPLWWWRPWLLLVSVVSTITSASPTIMVIGRWSRPPPNGDFVKASFNDLSSSYFQQLKSHVVYGDTCNNFPMYISDAGYMHCNPPGGAGSEFHDQGGVIKLSNGAALCAFGSYASWHGPEASANLGPASATFYIGTCNANTDPATGCQTCTNPAQYVMAGTQCTPIPCTNAADCNSHAASVSGDYVVGCGCSCRVGFTGGRCEACSPGRSGPNCDPIPCTNPTDCSSHAASVSGTYVSGCVCRCARGYAGGKCDSCALHYAGYPACAPIPCTVNADCSGHAGSVTGTLVTGCSCSCTTGFVRSDCSACDPRYRGYPNCQPIVCTNDVDCHRHAVTVRGTYVTGCECDCDVPRHRGATCERCAANYTQRFRTTPSGHFACETRTVSLTASASESQRSGTRSRPSATSTGTHLPSETVSHYVSSSYSGSRSRVTASGTLLVTSSPTRTRTGSDNSGSRSRSASPRSPTWRVSQSPSVRTHSVSDTASESPSRTAGTPSWSGSESLSDSESIQYLCALPDLTFSPPRLLWNQLELGGSRNVTVRIGGFRAVLNPSNVSLSPRLRRRGVDLRLAVLVGNDEQSRFLNITLLDTWPSNATVSALLHDVALFSVSGRAAAGTSATDPVDNGRPRMLDLALRLFVQACANIESPTQLGTTVGVQVPLVTVPPPLVPEGLQLATSIGAAVGSLAGAQGAMRGQALLALSERCRTGGSPPEGENGELVDPVPFPQSVWPGLAVGDDRARYVRGATAANLAFLGGVGLVGMPAGVAVGYWLLRRVVARRMRKGFPAPSLSLRGAAAQVGLFSRAFVPVALLAEGTIASSLAAMCRSQGAALDTALLAISVVVFGGALGLIYRCVSWNPLVYRLLPPVADDASPPQAGPSASSTAAPRMRRIARVLGFLEGFGQWVTVDAADTREKQRYLEQNDAADAGATYQKLYGAFFRKLRYGTVVSHADEDVVTHASLPVAPESATAQVFARNYTVWDIGMTILFAVARGADLASQHVCLGTCCVLLVASVIFTGLCIRTRPLASPPQNLLNVVVSGLTAAGLATLVTAEVLDSFFSRRLSAGVAAAANLVGTVAAVASFLRYGVRLWLLLASQCRRRSGRPSATAPDDAPSTAEEEDTPMLPLPEATLAGGPPTIAVNDEPLAANGTHHRPGDRGSSDSLDDLLEYRRLPKRQSVGGNRQRDRGDALRRALDGDGDLVDLDALLHCEAEAENATHVGAHPCQDAPRRPVADLDL